MTSSITEKKSEKIDSAYMITHDSKDKYSSGAPDGGVWSRFYWRGNSEVTKKNEVKGQRAETVRGHEIFKLQTRGLRISMMLLRGHQNHS